MVTAGRGREEREDVRGLKGTIPSIDLIGTDNGAQLRVEDVELAL